jgi:hypothetical protein
VCCTLAILSKSPAVLEIIEQRYLLFSPLSSHDSITVEPVTITLHIGIRCTDFFKAVFVPYLMPVKTGGWT